MLCQNSIIRMSCKCNTHTPKEGVIKEEKSSVRSPLGISGRSSSSSFSSGNSSRLAARLSSVDR